MASAPHSPEQITKAVKEFVARVTEQEPEDISDTAHFNYDLRIDSLMAMEMMVAVNKQFGIEILDEEFRAITNVRQAVAAVQRHLAAAGPRGG